MRLLVTGGSGFLGRELVPRLLKAGHQVYGLSRHGPDLVGDITQYNLGLKHVPRLDGVVHLAALMSFKDEDREASLRINSVGTCEVCEFCTRHSIPYLFHVSTAYVCGDATGLWSERDYRRRQRFKNPYEESKFLAEGHVREEAASRPWKAHPLKAVIFRPSIIVGRASDGMATSFEGFYYPLKAVAACQEFAERRLHLPRRQDAERRLHLPQLPLDIRIHGDPDGTLNLVPVDWVAQTMAHLINEEPSRPVRVYHLTNPVPPTNEAIIKVVGEALGLARIGFSPTARHDPLSDLYNRLIRPFSPYLWGEPAFISSVGANFPKLDLGLIIGFWRKANAGRPREKARSATSEADAGPGGRSDGEADGQDAGQTGEAFPERHPR